MIRLGFGHGYLGLVLRIYLDALATDEVLITAQGQNKFDDFGKKALFGCCYMFMDAQVPVVVRIVRHTSKADAVKTP